MDTLELGGASSLSIIPEFVRTLNIGIIAGANTVNENVIVVTDVLFIDGFAGDIGTLNIKLTYSQQKLICDIKLSFKGATQDEMNLIHFECSLEIF